MFVADATREQKSTLEQLRLTATSQTEEAADSERLGTALTWFKNFRAATGRVPFINPQQSGGKEYNQETFELFAEYIRAQGSVQKGRTGSTIRPDTIGRYVSAIKLATARAQRPLPSFYTLIYHIHRIQPQLHHEPSPSSYHLWRHP